MAAKQCGEEVMVNFDELFLIRTKLNREQIKLWLPPYTTVDGEKGEVPLDILTKYSAELSILDHKILFAFERLRCHALAKIKSKETFRSTGVATLNFNITWISETNVSEKMDISITATLDEQLSCVCERLSNTLHPHNFIFENIKLIHKGCILKHDNILASQNITNGSNIMVMLSLKSVTEQEDTKMEVSDRVSETRKLAEALAKRTDAGSGKHDHYFLEIRNQQGKKIDLPDDERQSLSVALTLHEKGRVLLKERNFIESLLLLLEADQNFNSCRADILNAVDNYALLCLDIVWCYFSLEKLDYLPDAEKRLEKCKECFKKSYGQNMERLNIVKGGDMNEMVLFVRVHILEAICNYLRGNTFRATELLNKAEEHLKGMEIDDDKFTQLVYMGFSTSEARLSLRACRGDITMAIEYITRKREEKELQKEDDKKERRNHKLAKKFGKTLSGDMVNIENLQNLQDMGFSRKTAADALKQSNNDVNDALELLQHQFNTELFIPPQLIHQFVSMGFEEDVVIETLEDCNCDPDLCLEKLVEHSSRPGTSTEKQSSSQEEEEDRIDAKVNETLRDIKENQSEDYLDLNLHEEAELINKYRMLIASLQQ